jgi:hypothetical protein
MVDGDIQLSAICLMREFFEYTSGRRHKLDRYRIREHFSDMTIFADSQLLAIQATCDG